MSLGVTESVVRRPPAAARGPRRTARLGHGWGRGAAIESAQPSGTRPVAALRRPER